nr:hypothetical protein [Rubellimicrobium mesophilum]
MRNHSVSPLRSACVITTSGFASCTFWPAAMKSSQVWIVAGSTPAFS